MGKVQLVPTQNFQLNIHHSDKTDRLSWNKQTSLRMRIHWDYQYDIIDTCRPRSRIWAKPSAPWSDAINLGAVVSCNDNKSCPGFSVMKKKLKINISEVREWIEFLKILKNVCTRNIENWKIKCEQYVLELLISLIDFINCLFHLICSVSLYVTKLHFAARWLRSQFSSADAVHRSRRSLLTFKSKCLW